MSLILRVIILALFAVVIFARGYFPSELVYWTVYAFMGLLVVLEWFSMFWVSKKKAQRILGFAPDFDIFVGRVPSDNREDLTRGRLCFKDGKAILVYKLKDKYHNDWQIKTEDIKSIGFGKVAAGHRKGFTIHTDDTDIQFTCSSINKHREELYKALGWE